MQLKGFNPDFFTYVRICKARGRSYLQGGRATSLVERVVWWNALIQGYAQLGSIYYIFNMVTNVKGLTR